jgi:hypothetical protein
MSHGTLRANIDLTAPEGIDLLTGQVKGRLHGRVRDLSLRLDEGVLILQGCATTYYAKQLAQHAVMEAIRCLRLVNEIEVRAV